MGKLVHAEFSVSRSYRASPAKVFAAFAEKERRAQWLAWPASYRPTVFELDFRVGGREVNAARGKEGVLSVESLFWDIVPNERIIYSYDILCEGVSSSQSLATIEFKPDGTGTSVVITEQGVYIEGRDDPGEREIGTRHALEVLATALGEGNVRRLA